MKNQNNFIKASITYSIEILNYVWVFQKKNKRANLRLLYQYFNKTESYTKSAVAFLEFHEIVHKDHDEITIDEDIYKKLDGTKELSFLAIKHKIVHFKPFIDFIHFINSGRNEKDSSTLVKDLYGLEKTATQISSIFNDWIKYFGISLTDYKAGALEYDIEQINNELLEEVTVIYFLKNKFREHYDDINQHSVDDLIEAIRSYSSNPKKSVNDAGRALEDFLRIDYSKGEDTSSCAGVVQVVNPLANKKAITSKHNGVVLGLGNIRSMGDAHGVDKNHSERWYINKESALLYINNVITAMISMLIYKKDNKLVF